MLSEARHSARSPSESVQTESVRTGPTTGSKGRTSRQSSAIEEEPNKIPLAPPLPPIFRVPPKSPSVSSSSSSSSSTRTESTQKSKSSVRETRTTKPNSGTTFPKPNLRRMSSDEKNRNNRQSSGITKKSSESKQKKGITTRISARDYINDKSSGTVLSYLKGGKTNQSIFEKIDTHDGHSTYLGSGSFFDLENCIRDCLSKNQCHIDVTHHSSRHDYLYKSSTRASVLEDYSYDGILEPKHHSSYSNYSRHHDRDYSSYLTDYHHSDHHSRHYERDYCNDLTSDHHSDHHRHHHDHKKHAAELSLDEIQQVNDSLAKYGVPLFSHHQTPHHPYQSHHPHYPQRSVGDIISACRLLINEPHLAGVQSGGAHAVQHVWDAIHNHPMPPGNPGYGSPANHGYASPAVRGVASHLFQPHQTPYDPVHGVASHLFGPPQSAPPPPQPPYNPGPRAPSYPYGPPPPAQQQSSGQSVLSRLFGSS